MLRKAEKVQSRKCFLKMFFLLIAFVCPVTTCSEEGRKRETEIWLVASHHIGFLLYPALVLTSLTLVLPNPWTSGLEAGWGTWYVRSFPARALFPGCCSSLQSYLVTCNITAACTVPRRKLPCGVQSVGGRIQKYVLSKTEGLKWNKSKSLLCSWVCCKFLHCPFSLKDPGLVFIHLLTGRSVICLTMIPALYQVIKLPCSPSWIGSTAGRCSSRMQSLNERQPNRAG